MAVEGFVGRLFWAGLASTLPLTVVVLLIAVLPRAHSRSKLWAIRIALFQSLLLLAALPAPLLDGYVFLPLPPGAFGPGLIAPEAWPKYMPLFALVLAGAVSVNILRNLVQHLLEVRAVSRVSGGKVEATLLEKYHDAAERVGSWSVPMLRTSTTARGPVIVGLRSQMVIIPEQLRKQLTEAEFELLVAHELHHYRRKDSRWACLPLVALLLFPWHPLIWWAAKRHAQITEESCDESVLQNDQPSRDLYARLLLRIASKHGLPEPRGLVAYGAWSSKKELASRIQNIYLRTPEGVRRAYGSILIAGSLFVLVPVRITICSPPRLGEASGWHIDPPRFTVRTIAVPKGFTQGSAVGVDARGDVIVNFERPREERKVARVSPGGEIHWLTSTGETPDSSAILVTKGGTVCGMATYTKFGGAHSAAWRPHSDQVLLVPNPLGPGGWCRGADDQGRFVGTSDVQRAWMFESGRGSKNLVLPSYCNYSSEAHAINSAGQVIAIASSQGMFQFPQAERRSFLVEPDGKCIDLGFLPRANQTLAFGLNDFGVVVGSSGTLFGRRPFCWTRVTGLVELRMPRGFFEGVARRINSNGWILGAVINSATDSAEPILWSPNLDPHLLSELVSPSNGGLVGREKVDQDWTDIRFGLAEDGSVAASLTKNGRSVPAVFVFAK